MIEGQIVDSFRLNPTKPEEKYAVLDELGNYSIIPKKKLLAYKSQTCNEVGLYDLRENLVGAKRIFLDNMKRQKKIVYGNSFYHYYKPGIYSDIIYFDFKAYYVKIFEQICNHIDEEYMGKIISSLAIRNTAIRNMQKNRTFFSHEALKHPLVDIDDIAQKGIKIDSNDKSEMLRTISQLSDATFKDEVDKRVSKITRNAMVFGFGYQQKNARVNNICALVMFFAKEVLKKSVDELMVFSGEKTIFSHTDSFMIQHIDTKDLDNAIRSACGLVDAEYFGNTEVISLGLNNISIKGKFEDLMILNQNSYIYSTIAPRGKRDIHLKIAGLSTLSECGLGIDAKGETIQDALFNNISDVFSWNKTEGSDREFLYSVMKYRLSPDYENTLKDKWSKNNIKELSQKAVIFSRTIKQVNDIKQAVKK